jgi:hypothetical protein
MVSTPVTSYQPSNQPSNQHSNQPSNAVRISSSLPPNQFGLAGYDKHGAVGEAVMVRVVGDPDEVVIVVDISDELTPQTREALQRGDVLLPAVGMRWLTGRLLARAAQAGGKV